MIPIYIGTDSLHIKRNRAQFVPPYSGSPLFKESALNKKFLTGMGCAQMALSEGEGRGEVFTKRRTDNFSHFSLTAQ